MEEGTVSGQLSPLSGAAGIGRNSTVYDGERDSGQEWWRSAAGSPLARSESGSDWESVGLNTPGSSANLRPEAAPPGSVPLLADDVMASRDATIVFSDARVLSHGTKCGSGGGNDSVSVIIGNGGAASGELAVRSSLVLGLVNSDRVDRSNSRDSDHGVVVDDRRATPSDSSVPSLSLYEPHEVLALLAGKSSLTVAQPPTILPSSSSSLVRRHDLSWMRSEEALLKNEALARILRHDRLDCSGADISISYEGLVAQLLNDIFAKSENTDVDGSESSTRSQLLKLAVMLGAHSFPAQALISLYKPLRVWRGASRRAKRRGLRAIDTLRATLAGAARLATPRCYFSLCNNTSTQMTLSVSAGIALLPASLGSCAADGTALVASGHLPRALPANGFTFALWFRADPVEDQDRGQQRRACLLSLRELTHGSGLEIHLCGDGLRELEVLSQSHRGSSSAASEKVPGVKLRPGWHWLCITLSPGSFVWNPKLVVNLDGRFMHESTKLPYPTTVDTDISKPAGDDCDVRCSVGASISGTAGVAVPELTLGLKGQVARTVLIDEVLQRGDVLRLYDLHTRESGGSQLTPVVSSDDALGGSAAGAAAAATAMAMTEKRTGVSVGGFDNDVDEPKAGTGKAPPLNYCGLEYNAQDVDDGEEKFDKYLCSSVPRGDTCTGVFGDAQADWDSLRWREHQWVAWRRAAHAWQTLPKTLYSQVIFAWDAKNAFRLGSAAVAGNSRWACSGCGPTDSGALLTNAGAGTAGSGVIKRAFLGDHLASAGGIERLLPILLECIHSPIECASSTTCCDLDAAMMARVISLLADIISCATSGDKREQQMCTYDLKEHGSSVVELIRSVLVRSCALALTEEVVAALAALADAAAETAHIARDEARSFLGGQEAPARGGVALGRSVTDNDIGDLPALLSLGMNKTTSASMKNIARNQNMRTSSSNGSAGNSRSNNNALSEDFKLKLAIQSTQLLFDMGIWSSASAAVQARLFRVLRHHILARFDFVREHIGVRSLLDALCLYYNEQKLESGPSLATSVPTSVPTSDTASLQAGNCCNTFVAPVCRQSDQRLTHADLRASRRALLGLIDVLMCGGSKKHVFAPYLIDNGCCGEDASMPRCFDDSGSVAIDISEIKHVLEFCQVHRNDTWQICDVLHFLVSLIARSQNLRGLLAQVQTLGNLLPLWTLLGSSDQKVVAIMVKLVHVYTLRTGNSETPRHADVKMSSGTSLRLPPADGRFLFQAEHATLLSRLLLERPGEPCEEVFEALISFALGEDLDASGQRIAIPAAAQRIKFSLIIRTALEYLNDARTSAAVRAKGLERILALLVTHQRGVDAVCAAVNCRMVTRLKAWQIWVVRLACDSSMEDGDPDTVEEWAFKTSAKAAARDMLSTALLHVMLGTSCSVIGGEEANSDPNTSRSVSSSSSGSPLMPARSPSSSLSDIEGSISSPRSEEAPASPPSLLATAIGSKTSQLFQGMQGMALKQIAAAGAAKRSLRSSSNAQSYRITPVPTPDVVTKGSTTTTAASEAANNSSVISSHESGSGNGKPIEPAYPSLVPSSPIAVAAATANALLYNREVRDKELWRTLTYLDLEVGSDIAKAAAVRDIRVQLVDALIANAAAFARHADAGSQPPRALLLHTGTQLERICQLACDQLVNNTSGKINNGARERRSIAGAVGRLHRKRHTTLNDNGEDDSDGNSDEEDNDDANNNLESLATTLVKFWSLFSSVVFNTREPKHNAPRGLRERRKRLDQAAAHVEQAVMWQKYVSRVGTSFLQQKLLEHEPNDKVKAYLGDLGMKPSAAAVHPATDVLVANTATDANSDDVASVHAMKSTEKRPLTAVSPLRESYAPTVHASTNTSIPLLAPRRKVLPKKPTLSAAEIDKIASAEPTPFGGVLWQVVDVLISDIEGMLTSDPNREDEALQGLSVLEQLLTQGGILLLSAQQVSAVLDGVAEPNSANYNGSAGTTPTRGGCRRNSSVDNFKMIDIPHGVRPSGSSFHHSTDLGSPFMVPNQPPPSALLSMPDLLLPSSATSATTAVATPWMSGGKFAFASSPAGPSSMRIRRGSLGHCSSGVDAFVLIDEPEVPLAEPDTDRLVLLVVLLSEWLNSACCNNNKRGSIPRGLAPVLRGLVAKISAELLASEADVGDGVGEVIRCLWLPDELAICSNSEGVTPLVFTRKRLFPEELTDCPFVAQLQAYCDTQQTAYEAAKVLHREARVLLVKEEVSGYETRRVHLSQCLALQSQAFGLNQYEEDARKSATMRMLRDRDAESFRKWKLLLRNAAVFPIKAFNFIDADTAQGIRDACVWKVDRRENHLRMRLRLKRAFGDYVANAATKEEKDVNIKVEIENDNHSNGYNSGKELGVRKIRRRISKHSSADKQPSSSVSSEASSSHRHNSISSTDWDVVELTSVHYAACNEHVVYSTECELILPMCVISGRLDITEQRLYFYGDFAAPPGQSTEDLPRFSCASSAGSAGEMAADEAMTMIAPVDMRPLQDWWRDHSDELKSKLRPRRFALSSLCDVHSRRYLLRRSALELFFANRKNYLFNFRNAKEARVVLNRVLQQKPPLLAAVSAGADSLSGTGGALQRLAAAGGPTAALAIIKQLASARLEEWTRQWENWEMSSFEYLMRLNTAAGRTYNDLTQYPVFPWVLSDYSSETIDLTNPAVYRDLSKPVGALEPTRLARLKIRKQNYEASAAIGGSVCHPQQQQLLLGEKEGIFGTEPSFLYGSHYSSVGTVLYFLLRVEPFATYAKEMQGGRFDHADRLFHSVSETWSNVLTSDTDLKELTPEWFYMDDLFRNRNSIDLGQRQDGTVLGDVQLPPWANGSASTFTRINMEALEGDFVSSNLHEWIDLIFGDKQRGATADKADNLFYYLTYEDAVDLETIKDPVLKHSIVAQIANFGQTPAQLFTRAHPQRKSRPPRLDRSTAITKGGNVLLKAIGSLAPGTVLTSGMVSVLSLPSVPGTKDALQQEIDIHAAAEAAKASATAIPVLATTVPAATADEVGITVAEPAAANALGEEVHTPASNKNLMAGFKRTKDAIKPLAVESLVVHSGSISRISLNRSACGELELVQLSGKSVPLHHHDRSNNSVVQQAFVQTALARGVSLGSNSSWFELISRAPKSVLLANGTALASCGGIDSAIVVHCTIDGRLLQTVVPFPGAGAVMSIALDNRSESLLAGCQDGSVLIWDLTPVQLAEESVRASAADQQHTETSSAVGVPIPSKDVEEEVCDHYPVLGDSACAGGSSAGATDGDSDRSPPTPTIALAQNSSSMTSMLMSKLWSAFRFKKTNQVPVVASRRGPRVWSPGFHTTPVTSVFAHTDLDVAGSCAFLDSTLVLFTISDKRFLRAIPLPKHKSLPCCTVPQLLASQQGRVIAHQLAFGDDHEASALHVVDVNGNHLASLWTKETVLALALFKSGRHLLVATRLAIAVYDVEALRCVAMLVEHDDGDGPAEFHTAQLSQDELSVLVLRVDGSVEWLCIGEAFSVR